MRVMNRLIPIELKEDPEFADDPIVDIRLSSTREKYLGELFMLPDRADDFFSWLIGLPPKHRPNIDEAFHRGLKTIRSLKDRNIVNEEEATELLKSILELYVENTVTSTLRRF
ncbi:MAG: hypothetical protein ACRECJ_03735, partial [Limisphaerales bacterium]